MKFKVYSIVDLGGGRKGYEVEYDGNRRLVKLLAFQHSLPQPDEIECIVCSQPGGKTVIKQDLIPFVESRYQVGGEYDFNVKNDFRRTNKYYELVDDHGLCFKLYVKPNDDSSVLVGQTVRCRVLAINGMQMQLKLVETEDDEDSSDGGDWQEEVRNAPEYLPVTPDYLLHTIEQLHAERADVSVDSGLLLDLIFSTEDNYEVYLSRSLPAALQDMEGVFSRSEIIHRLDMLRRGVLYILEESDCLLHTDASQRRSFRYRLAILAGVLEGYRNALQAFESGEVLPRLDRMLSNLSKSGYVYRAAEEFSFMQRVFNIDHSLIAGYMERIFSIIHERDSNFWRNEPFRTAFIRLLQLYMNVAGSRLDLATGDEDRRVIPLIRALAYQLKLANRVSDAGIVDFNLNLAMLYRLASHLGTADQHRAIRNAYRSLLDMDHGLSDFKWSDICHPDLLASKISSSKIKSDNMGESKMLEAGGVRLQMLDDGLVLTPVDMLQRHTENIFPEALHMRPGLKVMLDSSFSVPKKLRGHEMEKKDLSVYTTLWSDIEKQLFDRRPDRQRRVKKRSPVLGDECLVRVVEAAGPDRWRCVIEEADISGEGYMHTSEIVPYNTGLQIEDFMYEGDQLLLEARVVQMDSDGFACFSIRSEAFSYVAENVLNYRDRHACVLTVPDYVRGGGAWLGISAIGLGVSVAPENPDAAPLLKGGDIVICSDWEPGRSLMVKGVIKEVLDQVDNPLTSEKAVRNLLRNYASDTFHVEADEVMEEESVLDPRGLIELVNIIDRVATVEKDHILTYNYLGLARTLSKMIEDTQRYEFYQGWMKLIAILHHFTVNGTFNETDLKEFEDKSDRFDPQSEMRRRFLQLKIVSMRGKPESREILWQYTSSSDEVIRSLAENVLAYNLVSGDTPDSVRTGIDERIYQLLNVHQFNSTLYMMEADEGPKVEYKTSLVYPSGNHMRADMAVQTGIVLQGVCAMLNARGGTIYVGVNDYHAAIGIQNDLEYKEFKGDADKYDNAFRNALRAAFGKDVDAYVDTVVKSYNEKTVYEIHIRPYYEEPVRYQGYIYERHGRSKIRLEGDDENKFIRRRRAEAPGLQSFPPSGVPALPMSVEKGKAETDATAAVTAVQSEPEMHIKVSERVYDEDRVACGAARDADCCMRDKHPDILRYIQIMKGHYRMLDEVFDPDEEGVCLTLPVLESQQDWYLVLGYANGSACRLSLKNILDKAQWREYVRYTGQRLMFAEVAPADAALMSVGLNRKGQERIRIDSVERLAEVQSPNNKSTLLASSPLEEYVRYDIVPASGLAECRGVLDLPATDSGRLFRMTDSDTLYSHLRRLGLF